MPNINAIIIASIQPMLLNPTPHPIAHLSIDGENIKLFPKHIAQGMELYSAQIPLLYHSISMKLKVDLMYDIHTFG